MSYLSQMAGLAWHNFVSAAAGIAVAIAVIRGVARTDGKAVGNFWVDLTRSVLYVLVADLRRRRAAARGAGHPAELPCLYRTSSSLEGVKQSITGRPDGLAGDHQGTRHQRRRLRQRELRLAQREPDAAFSNLFELSAIFLISAALTYTYGRYRERSAARLGAVLRR